MNKILIFIALLWSVTNVLCFSELEETHNNNGPVTYMMENLAEHTATVTNQLLTDLATKTETTSNTLANNIETIVTSALQQLTQPFEDFQEKILSSQCQPLAELEQLNQQVNSDLSQCTKNVEEILKTFQQDSNEFKMALEKSIKDIIDLPKKCQNSGGSNDFGGLVSCYIGNIAEFNQQIAITLNNASDTIIHARQLGEKAMEEGRTCANEVVTTTKQSFSNIMSSCSKLLEQ